MTARKPRRQIDRVHRRSAAPVENPRKIIAKTQPCLLDVPGAVRYALGLCGASSKPAWSLLIRSEAAARYSLSLATHSEFIDLVRRRRLRPARKIFKIDIR